MAADDPIISVNEGIIREFRENNGGVGGDFEGSPLLILHTVGAKSKAQIEVGSEAGIVSLDVIASVLEERGRSTFYAEHAAGYPGFAQHQARTAHVISVVALDPRPSPTTR